LPISQFDELLHTLSLLLIFKTWNELMTECIYVYMYVSMQILERKLTS